MMSSYVKTTPEQIRYPSLLIFEIHLIRHDGQNLPSRAPIVCVVITFGQTFHQRGVNSTFLFVRSEASAHGVSRKWRIGLISLEIRNLFNFSFGVTVFSSAKDGS